jgi:hypothetical protein
LSPEIGFWVQRFWVLGSRFWVLGSGFRVLGSGFWVLGSGFRVQRFNPERRTLNL